MQGSNDKSTVNEKYSGLVGNEQIIKKIDKFKANQSRENLLFLLEAIHNRMNDNGQFLIPVTMPQAALDLFKSGDIIAGDTVKSDVDLHFGLNTLETADGKKWLVAFTSHDEYEKGEVSSIITQDIRGSLNIFKNDCAYEGIIINPWSTKFFFIKDFIEIMLNMGKPQNHISFVVGDITKLVVEAIVNAANSTLLGGGGVDGAIHKAAGPKLLLECMTLHGCKTGEAKITKGYNLKAKHIIHTVGPRYHGKTDDAMLLYACYVNSLDLAKKNNIHSIAFPAISTGDYGYPAKEAAVVALKAVIGWLNSNEEYGMEIVMCCYNEEMYNILMSASRGE